MIWPWNKIKDLKETIQAQQELLQEYERFYSEDVIKMATEAGQKIQDWENFFTDTLEDVQSVVNMLDKLMKRKVISDDPDVQNLQRVIVILKEILIGYIDAKKEKDERDQPDITQAG